eukprot:10106338-Lingulodinium_polyedra.AAC.1
MPAESEQPGRFGGAGGELEASVPPGFSDNGRGSREHGDEVAAAGGGEGVGDVIGVAHVIEPHVAAQSIELPGGVAEA